MLKLREVAANIALVLWSFGKVAVKLAERETPPTESCFHTVPNVIVHPPHSFSHPQWSLAQKACSALECVPIVRTKFLLAAHVVNAKDAAKSTTHLNLVNIAADVSSTATTL